MAEPRTTLSDEALERFLADRAPVLAPARLADDVLRGVVGLPQERRGWALPGFGGWSGTRSTLIPVAAVVAVGLLVALLGLVYRRPTAARAPRSRMGAVVDRGNRDRSRMVIGGGGDSLLAATVARTARLSEETVWRSTDAGAELGADR